MTGEHLPVFVSSHKAKLTEYQLLVGCRLPWEAIQLEEIQSLDQIAIVRHKVIAAHSRLDKPVWVEDTALYIRAWNGLPGPLIKWFLKSVGISGICQMISPFCDREAVAQTTIALYDTEIRIFVGQVNGTITLQPRGAQGFGWDQIFQPEGANLTFGEMTRAEKNAHSMRMKAFREFWDYVASLYTTD